MCDIFLDMIVEKSQSLMEKFPAFQEFIEYMTNTWIDDTLIRLIYGIIRIRILGQGPIIIMRPTTTDLIPS